MIMQFFYTLVQPTSINEDSKRHEFILNVLLVSIITLLSISILLGIIKRLGPNFDPANAMHLGVIIIITLFFVGLYLLSRYGKFKFSARIFLGIIFLLATYMIYLWGIEVQAALLFFTLVIVLSGILINAKSAFVVSILSLIVLFTNHYIVIQGLYHPDLTWQTIPWTTTELVVVSIIFLIIATVSWLSNREIERSLLRARKSESDLKEERDMLEIRVEERTHALQKMQMEKMAHVYKFAEFGRLSSGLFHDLVNPLMAVSLNIEKIRQGAQADGNFSMIEEDLERTKQVTQRMQQFIIAIKKQISHDATPELFSISQEINEAISVLTYRARKEHVTLLFEPERDIQTFGSPMKFNQVIINLISNAIDSYIGTTAKQKNVEISLVLKHNTINIAVSDHGAGIAQNIKDKIFTPFFTTKEDTQSTDSGSGIGLSLSKRIIEVDFAGTLDVAPNTNDGSIFTIVFEITSP